MSTVTRYNLSPGGLLELSVTNVFYQPWNVIFQVLFLLAKAIVIEIGLGFGFSDVAAELSNELPVTLRHSLILASKEQYFQTAEFTEAWDYLQTNVSKSSSLCMYV